jgi:type IV pilus assembly protein PilC
MSRVKRFLGISATVGGFFLLFGVLAGGLILAGLGYLLPFLLLLMLAYGWMLFAYLHYRQGRQEEVLHLLRTAAEAQAPLAPALWAYLHDRPQGPLREFWVGLILFFVLPGYYWVWHRRHNFDQKVARVAYHLEMGQSLSYALHASPGVVSKETALAVQVGEHTGRLAECLRASLPRSLGSLWLELVPRLLYPLLLLFFLSNVLLFWLNIILPRFERIFKEFGEDLPEETQRLMAVREAFHDFLAIAPAVVLGVAAAVVALLVSSTLRWYVPGVARLYRRHARGHVLKMLAVLLRAGTPAPEALALLADWRYFAPAVRRRLRAAGRRVEHGEPLADGLRQARLLPAALVPLVQAAERAQNLPWALAELGETLGDRTVRGLRRLSQFLSPLCVSAIGLLVGVIVLGMFMPMIALITSLAE